MTDYKNIFNSNIDSNEDIMLQTHSRAPSYVETLDKLYHTSNISALENGNDPITFKNNLKEQEHDQKYDPPLQSLQKKYSVNYALNQGRRINKEFIANYIQMLKERIPRKKRLPSSVLDNEKAIWEGNIKKEYNEGF